MKNFVLSIIRFYQRFLSFDTGIPHAVFGLGKICRFTPTCSEYTYQAVNRYGIMKGLYLGLLRVLRCHPASAGGFDPVP